MDGQIAFGWMDGLYIRKVKNAFGPVPDSGHGWPRHTGDKAWSGTLVEY